MTSSNTSGTRCPQHARGTLPDVIALPLFGSQANETARADSDVDLAILPRTPLDPSTRWTLQTDLEIALRRDVDCIDLRSVSTVMRMQVLRESPVLFEVGSYALLNQERAEILRAI